MTTTNPYERIDQDFDESGFAIYRPATEAAWEGTKDDIKYFIHLALDQARKEGYEQGQKDNIEPGAVIRSIDEHRRQAYQDGDTAAAIRCAEHEKEARSQAFMEAADMAEGMKIEDPYRGKSIDKKDPLGHYAKVHEEVGRNATLTSLASLLREKGKLK